MREHFAEAVVTGYEPLIGKLELPDVDDRHVLAAAIRCGAQYIVTDNRADFPAEVLARFDIEAIDADGILSRTFDLNSACCALFGRRTAIRPAHRRSSFAT